MNKDRIGCCQDSNNPDNPNKNWCVLEVAKFLGIDNDDVKYLHYAMDLVMAARNSKKITTSHITKEIGKYTSIGQSRIKLAEIGEESPNIIGFFVHIHAHVLFLDKEGQTIVDSDPRLRDKRKILGIWKFSWR